MFHDTTDLTGPSSLSAIEATCGLEEMKGIFPFEILDSLEALDRPELPSKSAAWRSVLICRGPTQEEVDLALRDFSEMGCSTVGDFLTAYLKTDITLTLDCASSILKRFVDKMLINPILQTKRTISSYAHSVVHARLEADKAPVIFSPSVPSTYGLLRNANKGELVCVLRNFCDPDEDSESAAVNNHLVWQLQRRWGAERPLPLPRKLTLVDEVASEVLSRQPEGLPLDNPPGLSVLPPNHEVSPFPPPLPPALSSPTTPSLCRRISSSNPARACRAALAADDEWARRTGLGGLGRATDLFEGRHDGDVECLPRLPPDARPLGGRMLVCLDVSQLYAGSCESRSP